MNKKPVFLVRLMVLLACLLTPPAWAHGDEDHSHAAESERGESATANPANPANPNDAPRASAQSEEFELVVFLADQIITLYLDDYATNAPVVDAQIVLESGTIKRSAKPIEDGVYQLSGDGFSQAGKYPLVFSIETADRADLLTLTLAVSAVAADIAPDITPDVTLAKVMDNRVLWWGVSAGALLLIVVAGIRVVLQRRRYANH